ncbi:mechanosensitive ion channel family protein [Shimia biformata]|uniref:mechanosensitive ion channel family protein n=1 Tax=Shimia biformata TaxID=1294299 RepID=UPI00194F1B0B|nr:mechanosensitive ion channel family protein [Shimia biformata]
MFRFAHLLLAIFLISVTAAAPGFAQSDAPAAEMPDPAQMTPEAIDAMVARMSDDQVRAFLLERLDAVAAQNEGVVAEQGIAARVRGFWTAFTSPMREAGAKIAVLPSVTKRTFSQFFENQGGGSGVMTLFGLILVALAMAFAVELAARKLIRLQEPSSTDAEASLFDALKFLGRRLMREIFGLIVFYAVLRILAPLMFNPTQLSFAQPFVYYLIWMPRLGAALSRFLLAPQKPRLRLVNVDNEGAGFLHRNLVGLMIYAGFTLFFVGFMFNNGLRPGETNLGYLLDSLIYVYVIYLVWSSRDALRQMMLGTDDEADQTRFDRKLAWSYPGFAIAVAVGTWVLVNTLIGTGQIAQLLKGAHYTTMFWLLAAPVIDTGIRGLVKHLVPPMSGGGPVAEAAYHATKRSYVRIGRVIAVGVLAFIITGTWDVKLQTLLLENAGIGDNLFRFLMTLVVGYLVYEGVSLYINRRLAAEQTALGMSQEDADAEMGGASGSRLSTVLPLMLLTARSAIIVIFGLLAIGNLGIDITPLLAGAGILGLAIGFGAQKLVTDVVSGVFFLIDDAFRTGDYVEIDGTMGAVEKISVRSMQLRHHRGPVHTIPYGEIPKLTNYSRDWVIMKLKFTVPFDTDPNKVKKIFKKIGNEMLEDPLYKDDFLQPFKSQGVFDFDDVGMVIRGKFMAKPGKQFMIRKEIYNRVKKEFEEAGIDFARREVRVAIPGIESHDEISEQDQAAIAAAAAAEAGNQQSGA